MRGCKRLESVGDVQTVTEHEYFISLWLNAIYRISIYFQLKIYAYKF